MRDEEMLKECHWKNTFHINITIPEDLPCDVIIASDQRQGTSILAYSYEFLCGLIFFLFTI